MTTQSEIILEAGKYYKCRNGKIITLEQDTENKHWLIHSQSGFRYSKVDEHGHLIYGQGSNHGYDIADYATNGD